MTVETPKPICDFCGQHLEDDATSCPRCGALVRFVENAEEGVRAMMEALEGQGATSPQVHATVVAEGKRLIVGWDDDEMLRVGQVARIMGLSTSAVTKLRQRGAFPHARRTSSTRPDRYRQGQWRYPRRDVWALLRGVAPDDPHKGANDR